MATDIRARLYIVGSDNVRPRVWLGESIRLRVDWTDGDTGLAVAVTGVTIRLLSPSGILSEWTGGAVLSSGTGRSYVDAVVDEVDAWSADARCASSTASVDALTFDVIESPVGAADLSGVPLVIVTSDGEALSPT